MHMTAAAAAAILAFTSSVAAYYPIAYDSSLYARDAFAEAEPDDFGLFARDAEPEPEAEFDIHPRDAYLSGYEAGLEARDTDDFYDLYARGVEIPPKDVPNPLSQKSPPPVNKMPVASRMAWKAKSLTCLSYTMTHRNL